jgi:hypothetical protein
MSGIVNDVVPGAAVDGMRAEGGPVTRPIHGPGIPLLYEDEGQDDMGDSDIHTLTADILFNGVKAHLAAPAHDRVFWNLNLYYSADDPAAYVSLDIMVVRSPRPLPEDVGAYRIGQEGPAPILVMEVLSQRTFQQRDLTDKPVVYAALGVAAYILVDVTGRFLPQRLILKQRQPDGTWLDEQDADGGVTSRLGFRLVIEPDGQVRVLDAATGRGYIRPGEAEQRVHELEAELDRLRRLLQERPIP